MKERCIYENNILKGKTAYITDDPFYFNSSTVNEMAVYGVMQQTLWDKITLNAGIRYEYNSVYGREWVPQGLFG